jgi:hypothetical protein
LTRSLKDPQDIVHELGVAAFEVWTEMDRRQALLGKAEKLSKESLTSAAGR